MRSTAAAAQTLPAQTPHRALLVFIAFAVAALSLLLQGGTMGLLVRALYGEGHSPAQETHDVEQRDAVLALLEAASAEADADLPEEASLDQQRLAQLVAQRDSLLDARDDGLFDAEVIEGALAAIDAEQIGLELRGGAAGRPPSPRTVVPDLRVRRA